MYYTRPGIVEFSKATLSSPGLEPGTFCVLSRCDDHYTTRTFACNKHAFQKCRHVFISRARLASQLDLLRYLLKMENYLHRIFNMFTVAVLQLYKII
ncbi:hypothetical protein T10_2375 [Trichinella papuae]|uniref:Uncharacterized protein n=1 Tax=Trichinella papuae TaxID=268474 RepID=A0A0V1MA23_9BILA|nr:hypothetical protein T10_2375 [Trichinella papuae]